MSLYTLSNIFIYPIKGCSGISLDTAEVEDRGLKYDRRWMLIDQTGEFISQRSFPQLALMDLAIDGDYLFISYEEKMHQVLLDTVKGQPVNVTVWDDTVKGFLTEEADHQWFSEILGESVRLVAMLDDSVRPVDPRFAISKKEEVSFADGYPFLIIGEPSLDLLNSKISGERLLIDRFRPNLVFAGGESHDEDSWEEFVVGQTHFYGVKPCARCQVITINQQTGEGGNEPLKTLNSYRKSGNKILFGQNCLLQKGNSIGVGDAITVIKKGNPPL